jgi:hypothetical protein
VTSFAGKYGERVDDLIAFVTARLDEREHFAKIARLAQKHREQMLREVEAGRLLLRQFELRGNSVRATVKPPTGGVWDDLLRILALPYADHPGYRPEWTP